MSRRLLTAAIAAGLPAVLASAAVAAPVDVPNASFELPAIDAGTSPFGNPADWTSTVIGEGTSNTQRHHPETPLPGQDGDQYVTMYLDGQGSEPGSPFVRRELHSADLGTLDANTLYTLTVGVGAGSNPPSNNSIGIGFYSVEDDTVFTEVSAANNTLTVSEFSDMTLTLDTRDFADAVGDTFQVVLFHEGTYHFGRVALFDNVRLSSEVIPEPASMALALVGLGGLTMRRKR